MTDMHVMFASQLERDRRPEEAEAHVRIALANDPTFAAAWAVLGMALRDQERIPEAMAAFRTGKGLCATNQLSDVGPFWDGISDCYHASGNLAEGGKIGRMLWSLPGSTMYVDTVRLEGLDEIPRWTGYEPAEGLRLLIRAESGHGDAVQHCRFAKPLADMGITVVYETAREMLPALAGVAGVSQFVALGDPLPPVDCWVGDQMVENILGMTTATIPGADGYITADPAKVAKWDALLPPGPRVGLVWGGNPANVWDPRRSIHAGLHLRSVLRPILDVPNVTFVSLQVGPRTREVDMLPGVFDATPHLTDFAETAGLLANLDATVAIESSVAHLAGAMGRPVFIMLPKPCCSRWLIGRDDSPWYSSARLFRQRVPGEWVDVIADVAGALLDEKRSRCIG